MYSISVTAPVHPGQALEKLREKKEKTDDEGQSMRVQGEVRRALKQDSALSERAPRAYAAGGSGGRVRMLPLT